MGRGKSICGSQQGSLGTGIPGRQGDARMGRRHGLRHHSAPLGKDTGEGTMGLETPAHLKPIHTTRAHPTVLPTVFLWVNLLTPMPGRVFALSPS